MPDLYLSIARFAHVGLGIVATFILFPIQIFDRKGGRLHRLVGRGVVWASIGIAVTGTSLLVDPLFLEDFWPTESTRLGYADLFEGSYYELLFFFFLVVTLLYFVLSGARIWARTARVDPRGRVPSTGVDWALTGVAMVFGLFYLAVGLHDLPSGQRFAWQFIGAAGTLLLFVGLDLITFVPRWSVRFLRWWWLLHVLKLFNAWHGLVDAFVLRLEVQYGWVLAHRPLITRGVWLIEIGVILVAMRAIRSGRFDPDQGASRMTRRAARHDVGAETPT